MYLRERLRTYATRHQKPWQRAKPKLIITEQYIRLDYLGATWTMQAPRVIYFSEFLLVLSFLPEFGSGKGRAVQLVLWPDSLARSEGRRLRRYLRFDLPVSL